MAFGKAGTPMAAALVAAAHLSAAAARADGALAVGTTGDVVKNGIAFGMIVDVPLQQALEVALARCRTFQAREAAKYCKVVATFSRECYAVAYDPAPGTPGAGWGIGKDQKEADARAIAMCQETAGETRRKFCEVEARGCDTRN
jgi:hypothetical protein